MFIQGQKIILTEKINIGITPSKEFPDGILKLPKGYILTFDRLVSYYECPEYLFVEYPTLLIPLLDNFKPLEEVTEQEILTIQDNDEYNYYSSRTRSNTGKTR